MSRQIGHFKFPDQPEELSVNHVGQPDPSPADTKDPGRGRQQSIEPCSAQAAIRTFSGTKIGAAVTGVTVLVLLVLSIAPFYRRIDHQQSIPEACGGLHGSDYKTCVEENSQTGPSAHLHWNAWGSWFSWPAIVLFLIVAAVVGFKAVFSKSEKVVLARQVRLALLLADLLFLVSVFHIPHDDAGRAWGLWLSLVCVIAINVGVLLATTHVGEWIAEHWPKRAKPAATPTEPTQQPYLPQQGDYRPTPQAVPPGQRQPSWPPQGGQQFPPMAQQQFPPTDQR